MNQTKESWHLSKSVPISFIFALLLQTAGWSWWLSAQSSTVENIQVQVASIEEQQDKNPEIYATKSDVEMLLQLRDERISNIHVSLDRIENKLDRLLGTE